jgi:hypothetical protein
MPTCQLVRAKGFRSFFEIHARESRAIRIAVAYFNVRGYEQIRRPLLRFLDSDVTRKCIFVVGLSSYYNTEPAAVEELLRVQKKFPNQLHLRYSMRDTFHPKIFVFEKPSSRMALVGSSNLTGGGTRRNVEANIAIEGRPRSENVLREISSLLSEISSGRFSRTLNRRRYEEYKEDYKRFSRHRGGVRTGFVRRLKPTGVLTKPATSAAAIHDYPGEVEELSGLQPKEIIWKISPGENAFQWPEYSRRVDPKTAKGVIAVGYYEIGDPCNMTFAEIARRARDKRRKKPRHVAKQLVRFFREMRVGNLIVAYGKSTIFDVGKVIGKATHLPSEDPDIIYGNQRPVRWFKVGPVSLTRKERDPFCYPNDTVHRITDSATLRLVRRLVRTRFSPGRVGTV